MLKSSQLQDYSTVSHSLLFMVWLKPNVHSFLVAKTNKTNIILYVFAELRALVLQQAFLNASSE